MDRQQKIDKEVEARSKRPSPAVGNNTPGGESMDVPMDRMASGIQHGAKPFSRKGIKLHDKTPETWGLSKVPRYEE